MQGHDEFRTPSGHVIHSEGDLTLIQFHGRLTMADAEVMSVVYETEFNRHGYLLLLADLKGAAGSSPEARRKLVLWAQPHGDLISVAGYGGTILVRSFMKLMNGAMRLISGKQSALEFFRTEAEARQFLANERMRLLQPSI